ncbi:MAG: flagellar hook basal-body protein [Planctomycetota bacterium]
MPYGLYLSAAGAHAQNHRMEVLSHNLANVNTPGFKPQQVQLQARFAELIENGEVSPGLGGADDIGGGVTIGPTATQFKMGAVQQTGRRTDFAIEDPEAFFAVRRDGETLLTRAGNFLFDSTGKMVNTHGDAVLSAEDNEIRIDPTRPYDIGAGGFVMQAGRRIPLMLAKPQSLGDLSASDENHFKPLAALELVPPASRRIINGAIEQSAVSPTAAMMEMVETSRAYEANVRMIQNQDSVTGSLISRVLG